MVTVSPSAETLQSLGLGQIPSPALTPCSTTSPLPMSHSSLAAASLYQGRPLAPTAPYTLTNGAAAAALQHTDLSCYATVPMATASQAASYAMIAPGKLAAQQAHLPQSKGSRE